MSTTTIRPAGYEILYDLPAGEYDQRAVGGIQTTTIHAGTSLEVICYPITRVDAGAKREAARRRSTPAQQRLNQRNTQLRIMRLAECNFTAMDYFVTLTWAYPAEDPGMTNLEDMQRAYEDAGVPEDIEGAARAWTNFLNRLKRRARRQGGDPAGVKYIHVIESGKDHPGGGLPAKYHIHALIHAPGLTDLDLKALWPHGFTRCDRIDMEHEGAERLSKYLTKQRRYERRWGHSRNLREPEVRVSCRKVSRRRTARVAEDVRQYGREIFEALYPGYRCVEFPEVRYSDFVAGARIYARMRASAERTEAPAHLAERGRNPRLPTGESAGRMRRRD